MYKIIFYKDKNGNEPIKDFIDELERKGKTSKNDRIQYEKIRTYIDYLETQGTNIGLPVVKHIEGKIWELRPLDNRIFFFCWQRNSFVMLHHFIKKTRKTPRKEIRQAKRNLENFIKIRSKEDDKNR